jgi:hypothetical protein
MRPDCMRRLVVPAEVYETVRTTEDRFLVASGHEGSDRILVGTERYSVVAAADIAPAEALPATA